MRFNGPNHNRQLLLIVLRKRAAGYFAAVLDTSFFANNQVPHLVSTPLTSTTRVLALQLGNCYGLLALIGVGILYQTNEAKVVRNFLVACAVADVGHLWVTYTVVGHTNFVNIQTWNSLAWGNIGITTLLFVVRMAYLSGFIGKDRIVVSARKWM